MSITRLVDQYFGRLKKLDQVTMRRYLWKKTQLKMMMKFHQLSMINQLTIIKVKRHSLVRVFLPSPRICFLNSLINAFLAALYKCFSWFNHIFSFFIDILFTLNEHRCCHTSHSLHINVQQFRWYNGTGIFKLLSTQSPSYCQDCRCNQRSVIQTSNKSIPVSTYCVQMVYCILSYFDCLTLL